jgi:hypothetical protein
MRLSKCAIVLAALAAVLILTTGADAACQVGTPKTPKFGAACPAMDAWKPVVCDNIPGTCVNGCNTTAKVDTYLETLFSSNGPATDDDCYKQLAATGDFGGRTNWCKTTDDKDRIRPKAVGPITGQGSWCDWACAYGGTMYQSERFLCTSTDCDAGHFGKAVSCQSIKAMMNATCNMTQAEMDAVIADHKPNGCSDDGPTFSIPSQSTGDPSTTNKTATATSTPAPSPASRPAIKTATSTPAPSPASRLAASVFGCSVMTLLSVCTINTGLYLK